MFPVSIVVMTINSATAKENTHPVLARSCVSLLYTTS